MNTNRHLLALFLALVIALVACESARAQSCPCRVKRTDSSGAVPGPIRLNIPRDGSTVPYSNPRTIGTIFATDVEFQWDTTAFMQQYEVRVDSSARFDDLGYYEMGMKRSRASLALMRGAYYARVRAFNQYGCGPWSRTIRFAVGDGVELLPVVAESVTVESGGAEPSAVREEQQSERERVRETLR